ncbi:MAG: glycosyl hydrolase [Gemmatimonadales bacterium]|nr:glycosyl hydrolase [Gemmatimonadales bacterium]
MRTLALALGLAASVPLAAQTPPAADSTKFATIASGLRFRSIGPALTSGRVADIAVHPTDKRIWYVASAAGGVWKTVNAGISFTPVFDGEGSFSIGVVTIDERNPNVVWVGTGENNAQRVVAYGDGVYKSIDGGKSWSNVGLKSSEHIGRILIDPRNSDVVYVAAQGPLWSKGGERGVYKTTDGGKTWARILSGDDWTGANDIQLDPRNPDVLIATLWQRHRRTCCFVAGGPGSGVHRSIDGGKSWNKSQSGFPSEDLGRIGLSISPANPSVVYAIADAAQGRGGLFRSRDGGASWERMSGYQSGSNYYNEVFADPNNVDRVYAADVLLQVSEDGGRTFRRVGELLKHVDNHSVWIDPDDTDRLIVGSDGGVYESVDRGRTWRYMANLPITQYYRVATDDSRPFYRVFGGAQDNFSIGGPSRTRTNNGIRNADWFITSGGDGFGSVVDPTDPNIVYAQSQFGVLSRFNLRTGDVMGIQPEDAAGGPGFRWNWDSPLFISPHSHTRLYFAANRVFRSDDRGDSWRPVSPDLTRQLDRNAIKVMDRIWGVDAVAKNASTTLYGNIFALAESPLKEGLLFAGTDDGRIQISENGGESWRAIDRFPGVPDTTFVSRVVPSQHDANTVYATFNNHQHGDFKPYVLKSTDLGRTWTGIAGDLPARGSVWVIAEDHVDKNLLFVGTEFGVFVSREGGSRWVRLKTGLPTIQVRDIAIQKRANDLVLATFGRGFYIMDDYSALREWRPEFAAQPARLFSSRPAYLYAESSPLGLPGASFQGHGHYVAENPPYGAWITYYLKDGLKSERAKRREADAAAAKKNQDTPVPAWDSLKVEDRQEDPAVVVTIGDSAGRMVRRFTAPAGAGVHRVAWDLRLQPTDPVNGPPYQLDPEFPFSSPPAAPFVVPGTYTVALWARVDGAFTPLGSPTRVTVVDADPPGSRPNGRTGAILAEQMRTAELERSVLGAGALLGETLTRMGFLKRAIDETPGADTSLSRRVRALEQRVRDAQELLNGDPTRGRRNEASPPSLRERLQGAIGNGWSGTLEAPTAAQQAQIDIVRAEFGRVLERITQLVEVDLRALETAAEQAGVPWTSGRLPRPPR